MELILLSCFAAVAVWGAIYLRWTGLWGCLLLLLIAGTMFGHPFFHFSVVTSDRLLLGLSLLVYLAYRLHGTTQLTNWHWIDSVVIVLVGVLILTTFMVGKGGDASSSTSKLLFFYLLPVCMYWLGRRIELTPVHLRWMFATFAAMGFYLALTAAAEKYGLAWAVFPRYIVDANYAEFLGRGRGPLLNPTGNGVLLTMGMSCALMFYPSLGKFGRIALLSSVPIYMLGIYCTLTRCVWIGGAAALVGITWVAMPTRWRVPFAIAILCGSGLLVAAKSESFVSFKRDKNVSVADMKQSAHLRPILAAFAWQMFQDRPLMGCGTGRYLDNVESYLGERKIDLPMTKAKSYVQHNVFLALVVENGLIGLLPFTILLTWSSWCAWRLWQAKQLALEYRQTGLVFLAFITAYLTNGMFHDLLIVPMMSTYLFFFVGAVRNLTGEHLLSNKSVGVLQHESWPGVVTAIADR